MKYEKIKKSHKASLLIIKIFVVCGLRMNTGFSNEMKPLINEVMPSIVTEKDGNTTWGLSNAVYRNYNYYRDPSEIPSIPDEDGDYSDWIEIFNPSSSPVDLTGYGLSDRPSNPFKWIFPEYSLGSGQHLLVFASGKDRKDIVKHWETVITQGDEWRYCIPESETPETWRLVGFDDSGWDSGPSGFGFYYDLATTLPQTVSFYIRKSFTVNDIANITACLLQIDYDDAFVAYFNGTEIARANIGETGIPPPYDSKARKTRKVQLFEGGNPDVFEIENIQSLLVQGENVLAIQIHNIHPKNSTMAAIPFLTFGMTIPPPNPRGMPDFLKFSIKNYMHTNFKIKATGETLVLTDSSGDMCDRLETGYIPSDMSWGRQPDGGTQLVFFSNPTPGNSNTTTGQIFADSVTVSHSGGFYDSSISLTLSCNSSTAVIRYTKDGSDPTESSDEYYASIPIAETTVIKARAFETGLLPGKIAVHTYFINEKSTLPIISIATDPDGFFSSVKGIYLNEHQRTWEREVHLEYYEPNGHLGFSINAGTKIRGQSSSGFPQKSLSIFVRGQYGYEVINYQIFPDSPITEFKSLILRNSGNDWPYTMFRDGLNASLFKGVDLDIQEYRPAVVYINGKYWGIHNIREKYNEEYFESHHGADPDNIDFLELTHKSEHPGGALLIEGDYEHYDSMLEYMTDHDLSVDEYYNYIKTQMDIPSYINYMILEIHGSNGDWLGRNMKLWRPRTPEGKWRWLPFDLDFTFGGSVYFGNVNDMTGFNTLAYASDPSKCPWPAWTTFVFRKLLENRTFKYDFINRFADCMNTFLHTSVVMQKIHEVKSAIEPEMPNHIWRWNDSFGAINSMYQWNMEVQSVEEFCETRVDSLRTYISDEFNLSGTAQVNLNVSQPGTGIVILNTLTLDEFPWRGIYFKDVPVRITAQSSYGYRFAGWSGIAAKDSISADVIVTSDLTVTAHFEKASNIVSPIVINEINYNSSSDFDSEDWIEFYNNSDSAIDITGWVFKDEDNAHKFIFPENTIIGPENYLVLCRDMSLFTALFPGVSDYVGDMNFGLSSRGELIRLFDAQGGIVDSLTYDNNPPWPEEADGGCATLSLRSPDLDNSLSESWAQSEVNGTPGEKNEYIVSVEDTYFPTELSLGQNFPNPFNPETTIEFTLPSESAIDLSIYNIMGQKVRTLISGELTPGNHYAVWDGRDDDGNSVSSGVYLSHLSMGEKVAVKSMMLLK